MGALKRWLILFSITAGFGHAGVEAAEFRLGLPPGSYVSSLYPFTLAIHLQALSVTDSRYIRSTWLDEVNVTAVDETGREIPLRVVARRRGQSTLVKSNTPRNGIREDGVGLRAEFDVDGFPAGPATIRVEYQDLSSEMTLNVLVGDAQEKARFSEPAAAETKPKSYAEYRAEAMRRLEEIPDAYDTLWKLAERALLFAPREEAETYFTQSIAARYAYIERLKQSEDPVKRARAQEFEAGLPSVEAMANAVRSLLPEYYANRDQLLIDIDWKWGKVLLLDRKSGELIKAVPRWREGEPLRAVPEHTRPD